MKVYLAGKMDAVHGAWRDALLERQQGDWQRKHDAPYWEIVKPSDDGSVDFGQIGVPPWPTTPNTRVLGLHEYVGPYRTTYAPEIDSKYTGYFHGSTVTGQHGQSNWDDHASIIQQCWRAISLADLVFVYVNSPDCFGTLAEIGMAKGLGRYVVASFESGAEWDWADYWFCGQLCDAVVGCSKPIAVGPEPPRVVWGALSKDRQLEELAIHVAWEQRRDAEAERIRSMLKDAILQWTARPERPAPVALVRQNESERLLAALTEAANSFAQIGHWSADPRVRNEAQRMLRRIAG